MTEDEWDSSQSFRLVLGFLAGLGAYVGLMLVLVGRAK